MGAMKHNAPSHAGSRHRVHRPSLFPRVLLHMLAMALIGCIVSGGVVYLYSKFNDIVSANRRDMNALAYNAQVFFDRREALLRSVTAAMIQPASSGLLQPALRTRTPSQELFLLPITDAGPPLSNWHLLMSTRDREMLSLQNVRILHTATTTQQTHALTGTGLPIAPAVQKWIADFLSKAPVSRRTDGYPPIYWLRPPADILPRLFLYTPLNTDQPEAGWVGLEVNDIGKALQNQSTSQADHTTFSFVLLTPKQQVVLHRGDPADFQWYKHTTTPTDGFTCTWENKVPKLLILSKSIGEGGWRLAYYAPIHKILSSPSFPLYPVLLAVLTLCALVMICLWQIHRKLLLPALHQYAALQDNERLTQAIIQSAPVGLCLLDRSSGNILKSNALAMQWLDSEDYPQRQTLLEQLQTDQERTLLDGRSVYLKCVNLQHHSTEVVLCAVNDITALKDIERSLVLANQKADIANKAKTDFIATMSHEIRTPLFGIMGTLELLAHTSLTSAQQQHVQTLRQSADTLLRTTNETLDFSRVEAGHEQLQLAELSPVDLVHQVIASYTDRARAKGLLLYCVADCQVPHVVQGDELRLRQILNNLVSNALKFTIGGHIVLRLKLVSRHPERVTLCFQIADTGIGISSEHQEKLFSPYYRIANHAPDDTKQVGTGLGLFICSRLAELMNGAFSVVSTVGLGTSIEFTVTLPCSGSSSGQAIRSGSVYVHGAIQEVVSNLCDWLNHWGIHAISYQPGDERDKLNALLLCAWPAANHTPEWKGPQLIMLPAGLMPDLADNHKVQYCQAFDQHDLKRALGALLTSNPSRSVSPEPHTFPTLSAHILAVDDNAINLQILQEQLQLLGCTMTLANDAQEAFQYLERYTFDLMLVDINIPVMDGYAISRRLRQQGLTIPIYGVTASPLPTERKRAHAAGMNDLLLRPLSLDLLQETLQQATQPGKT